ncbi:oxidoreductase [Aureococcus anophagefferens]|nr:oxidoreductase [Aureococcus anophagefferens]
MHHGLAVRATRWLWLTTLCCAVGADQFDRAAADESHRSLRAAASRDQFDRLRLQHPGLRRAKPRTRSAHGMSPEAALELRSKPTPRATVDRRVALGNSTMPAVLYGTAWKKAKTAGLVFAAVKVGFAGIDTATAKKHYNEAGVGDGSPAAARGRSPSSRSGHDPGEAPWGDATDPRARRAERAAALANLKVTKLDAFLLHGPSTEARRSGKLMEEDFATWAAIARAKRDGLVGAIGVSNVDATLLRQFLALPDPPQIVQNRCFASSGWDYEIRGICREHRVVYEGCSLLTANRDITAGGGPRAARPRPARRRRSSSGSR